MANKLILQDLTNALSDRTKQSKKNNDIFVRAFFETIEESLEKERFVKIKGWGTFKLIAIGERESINISTGERFQIDGHYRICFVPENGLKENINKPFSHFQTITLNENVSSKDLEIANEEEKSLREGEGNSENTLGEEENTSVESIKNYIGTTPQLKVEVKRENTQKEDVIALTLQEKNIEDPQSNSFEYTKTVTSNSSKQERTGDPIKETKTESMHASEKLIETLDTEHAAKNAVPNDNSTGAQIPFSYDGQIEGKNKKEPIEIKITELPAITFARSWQKLLVLTCIAIGLCLGYLIGYYRLVGSDHEQTKKYETDSSNSVHKSAIKLNVHRMVTEDHNSDPVIKDAPTKKETIENHSKIFSTKNKVQVYKVKKGESLYDISNKFYNSEKYVDLIIRYNHITNPDCIPYDTILRIPSVKS